MVLSVFVWGGRGVVFVERRGNDAVVTIHFTLRKKRKKSKGRILREKRARATASEDTNDTDTNTKRMDNDDCNTDKLLKEQSQLSGNNVDDDINELRQRLKAKTDEISTLSRENRSLKEEITILEEKLKVE